MPRQDGSNPPAGPSSQASSSRSTPQKRPLKRRREPTTPPTPDRPTHYPDEEAGPPPTQELDELLVSFRTEVVGIQYYQGLVGRGERVMLRREPSNAYDTNAVQVLNASGVQVGHLPRGVAARLAYLMDLRSITVEGTMLGQNLDRLKRYKLPMELGIYARPSLHAVLEPELEWATPEEKGFEYMRMTEARRAGKTPSAKSDADTQRILEGLTKVSKDESAAGSVMAALTANIDVAHLPVHPSPPSVASGDLTTDLLPHQSQALQWMVDHENPVLPKKPSDPPVQFWKRHQAEARAGKGAPDYWLNVATQTPMAEAPVLGRGGILADGMGLGKTLTILALILATRKEKVGDGYTRTNLIVCPAGVMSNWEKQIRDHVVDGRLKYYVYHGAKKGLGPKELAKYDVVLTTYGTITEAYGNDSGVVSQKRELKKMKWKRVIADEGHVMKNPKTKMHEAFVSLQAERRWVCTGTPIVNGPSDLGSLLQCVGVCSPLDQPEFFRSLVLRPLKRGSTEASQLLQAIVAQALLHRTKNTKDKDGNSILALPPIEYYQVPVTLDAVTRSIYNELYEQSLRYFRKSLEGDTEPGAVLSLLTRMRQLCLSADLVPKWQLDNIRNSSARAEALSAGEAIAGPDAVTIQSLPSAARDTLIQKLRQAVADQEECPVCFDILNDPRITDCGHSFCLACIAEVIRLQAACPMERHGITRSSLLELPSDEEDDEFEEVEVTPPSRSAKIVELVRYLKAFDASDKTLVFSQFTTFLDRVAGVLAEEGISFCRFDGSMTLVQRRKVIEQFQAPVTASKPGPVVMLISLKSGGVGLNLSAANNVFLCDPWWQSAIEAQAVDRAHRMGQRRTVRVFQLIAEDTVESRVLEIQKRKDKMVAKAFEKTGAEPTRAAKKKARFEELKELFGVVE